MLDMFCPWTDVWSRSSWVVQVHFRTGIARVLLPSGRQVATGSQEACLAFARLSAPQPVFRRAVVLMHGLGHDPSATGKMARAFHDCGWGVANFRYSSMRGSFASHAKSASRVAKTLADDGAEQISFIGHSLGGLVARAAMAQAETRAWTPGRLLLVGSPARGAALADYMSKNSLVRALSGEGGKSVTHLGAAAVPLPVVPEVGIIAGGNGHRGFNHWLDGDNDGIVKVDEARMPEFETAYRLLPAKHTALAYDPQTVASAVSFLSTGLFAPLH